MIVVYHWNKLLVRCFKKLTKHEIQKTTITLRQTLPVWTIELYKQYSVKTINYFSSKYQDGDSCGLLMWTAQLSPFWYMTTTFLSSVVSITFSIWLLLSKPKNYKRSFYKYFFSNIIDLKVLQLTLLNALIKLTVMFSVCWVSSVQTALTMFDSACTVNEYIPKSKRQFICQYVNSTHSRLTGV